MVDMPRFCSGIVKSFMKNRIRYETYMPPQTGTKRHKNLTSSPSSPPIKGGEWGGGIPSREESPLSPCGRGLEPAPYL